MSLVETMYSLVCLRVFVFFARSPVFCFYESLRGHVETVLCVFLRLSMCSYVRDLAFSLVSLEACVRLCASNWVCVDTFFFGACVGVYVCVRACAGISLNRLTTAETRRRGTCMQAISLARISGGHRCRSKFYRFCTALST